MSGDLESDLQLQGVEQERRRLSGSLGDGEASLTISSTSGDISVSEE